MAANKQKPDILRLNVSGTLKEWIVGNPDRELVSTSYVERQTSR
jgi:hypothetical protein